MPTTTHPSSLPEQEPTSHTAAVLCDGEAWLRTGIGWESRTQWLGAWEALRAIAAEKGGATLLDITDLTTGLTEAQKGRVRFLDAKIQELGYDEDSYTRKTLRDAFPGVFADDLVTTTWKSGDLDEKWADLLRVARMDGAHAVGTQSGVTYSGMAFAAHSDHISIGCTSTGRSALAIPQRGVCWTITVTAPKPADPTGGDPVVRASLVFVGDKKCIFFRAQDGLWSRACDSEQGMWDTSELAEIERLSAQTISELMGGEGNE